MVNNGYFLGEINKITASRRGMVIYSGGEVMLGAKFINALHL